MHGERVGGVAVVLYLDRVRDGVAPGDLPDQGLVCPRVVVDAISGERAAGPDLQIGPPDHCRCGISVPGEGDVASAPVASEGAGGDDLAVGLESDGVRDRL